MAHQHRRGIPRTQTALLPPAIEDYVGEDALVRVIDLYVEGLDLVGLGFKKSVALNEGRPPYAPADLLKLYVYGYWNRIRTSRRLEAECRRNLELMWLVGQLVFDHKTIADFRRENAQPFKAVCAQFVQFLREVQLVGGAAPVVAVDGSKFKASASKASLVSAKQAAKQRARIEQRIAEYLAQMDEADRQERGEAEPDRAQIEAALKRLRQRDERLEQAQAQLAAQAEGGAPRQESTPRVGLTDPDCVMLQAQGGAAVAGYNVQQAVDAQHRLIVAHEVSTERNDHASLEPMATQAQQALGAASITVVADTGYMNGAQAAACEAKGITPVVPMQEAVHTQGTELYPKTQFSYDPATDTYRCPAGQVLHRYQRDRQAQTDYYWTSACAGCPHQPHCTRSPRRSIARSWHAAAAERAHQRAQQRALMRLRSATVEHPFGNLKAMMPGGFLLRTLPKIRGEMALAVLTYNLKRTLSILGFEQLMQKLQLMSAPTRA